MDKKEILRRMKKLVDKLEPEVFYTISNYTREDVLAGIDDIETDNVTTFELRALMRSYNKIWALIYAKDRKYYE